MSRSEYFYGLEDWVSALQNLVSSVPALAHNKDRF